MEWIGWGIKIRRLEFGLEGWDWGCGSGNAIGDCDWGFRSAIRIED